MNVYPSVGEPVARTTVVLTSTTGEKREVKSTSFGYFAFGGLEIGQTYTVTVRSKRHAFAPVTVSAANSVMTGRVFPVSGFEYRH